MSGRPGKKPGPLRIAGATATPGGFRSYLVEFLDQMAALRFSTHTIKNRRIELGYFIDWCEERGLSRPDDITRAMLERYRQHVFHYRTRHQGGGHGSAGSAGSADSAGDDAGAPLSFHTQAKRLISVRMFFQWLARSHHLLYNPASELELPRPEQRLPRHILTVAEVEQVINAIDTLDASGLGVRDRAMLELLYSTGMRRGELVALRIDDVDLTRGTALIRQGKGAKDRMVPVGERACRWAEKYLYTVRERLRDVADTGVLFLARHGEGLQGKQLSVIVRKAIASANLARFADTHPNAACHLFRHACATHMLENGADIRYIQALLGHADLSTTEVYTRVSIMKLKEVHAATHPARLQPRQGAGDAADGHDPQAARAALLRALDAEAGAEGIAGG